MRRRRPVPIHSDCSRLILRLQAIREESPHRADLIARSLLAALDKIGARPVLDDTLGGNLAPVGGVVHEEPDGKVGR